MEAPKDCVNRATSKVCGAVRIISRKSFFMKKNLEWKYESFQICWLMEGKDWRLNWLDSKMNTCEWKESKLGSQEKEKRKSEGEQQGTL